MLNQNGQFGLEENHLKVGGRGPRGNCTFEEGIIHSIKLCDVGS